MEYSKLVAVTGMPGLYELVNSKTDGAIVRSLEDNSTKFASSRIHSFSQLESIEVYTVRDNVNLVEIFHAMDKAGGSLPDGKDNSLLKKYFEKTYPDLDFERVYASDLKKMVKWFEILKKQDIEIKLSEPVEEEPEEDVAEEVVVEKKSSTKSDNKEKPFEKPAKKTPAPEITKKAEQKSDNKDKKEKEEKSAKEVASAKPTTSVKKKAEPKKESPASSKKEKVEAPKPARSEGGKKAAPKKK